MTKTEINTICKMVCSVSEADRELGIQYLENLKDSNISSTGALQILIAIDNIWPNRKIKYGDYSYGHNYGIMKILRELKYKVWHHRVKLKNIRL